MNINIFTGFSKKKNSTKVPTGTGTAVTASLKRQTSYHNPVFVLSPVTGVNMEDISYIKYGSHYYFVTDITVVPNNVYEISCAEDPMATHRSEILGSKQYVLYSASDNRPFVPDPRIPKQSEVMTKKFTPAEGTPFVSPPSGYFILTCLSSAGSSPGGRFMTSYLCEEADVRAMCRAFVNNTFSGSMFLSTTDAFDCVTNLAYIPLGSGHYPAKSANKETIYLGDVTMSHLGVDATGFIVSGYNNNVKLTATFTPSWTYFNDWRLAPPYTTATLYIPGYGTVDINPLHCDTSLKVETYVDVFTGDTTSYIYGKNQIDTDYNLMATINYNIAIQIPVGKYTSNAMGALSALVTAGGSGVSIASGNVGGGLYGVASSIGNAIIQANTMTASVKGSTGGTSWLSDELQCVLVERCINTFNVDIMKNTEGMPLMEEATLSTLSGYCKCENASVSISGYDSDRDYINNVLNSGFFIE